MIRIMTVIRMMMTDDNDYVTHAFHDNDDDE